METLDQIGVRHNTEKSSLCHDYLNFYDEIFASYKDKPIVLIEQGILKGESLLTWNDYFTHPDTTIAGLDVQEFKHAKNNPRIRTFKGSQSDASTIDSLVSSVGTPDIVIDDAGHMASDQIKAFSLLWPLVNPGGLYIIEDLHTAEDPKYLGTSKISIINYLLGLVPTINRAGNFGYGKKIKGENLDKIKSVTFRKLLCIIKKECDL